MIALTFSSISFGSKTRQIDILDKSSIVQKEGTEWSEDSTVS